MTMTEAMIKNVEELEAEFPQLKWTNALRELVKIAWLRGQRYELNKRGASNESIPRRSCG